VTSVVIILAAIWLAGNHMYAAVRHLVELIIVVTDYPQTN
jgi:hypothetical protein